VRIRKKRVLALNDAFDKLKGARSLQGENRHYFSGRRWERALREKTLALKLDNGVIVFVAGQQF